MYTVSARAHYDSAHYLEGYEGKCSRVHGHHYVVEAAISVQELGDHGFAFDFVDLKRELRALAEELDHHLLNDLPQFEGTSTSAEVQAKYFHDRLRERLPSPQSEGLAWVRIWETPTSWAQYGPVPGWAPPPGGSPPGGPAPRPPAPGSTDAG